jgi:hypothetical protein
MTATHQKNDPSRQPAADKRARPRTTSKIHSSIPMSNDHNEASAVILYQGGARIGWFNASYPLASLTATRDMIRISCFGSEYSFFKDTINGLTGYRGLFSVGLRIAHTMPIYPPLVVFWTDEFERLKANLEDLGYDVQAKRDFGSNILPMSRIVPLCVKWGIILLLSSLVWNLIALFLLRK